MTSFRPDFNIKIMGGVTAEFTGPKTTESLSQIVEWIKKEKWRGCLEVNFVGNGGTNGWVFRETPKRMVEEPELPY